MRGQATEAALEVRAGRESREQALFDGFFAGHMRMLPKRYNVEQRFWDKTHDQWRAQLKASQGAEAVPLGISEAAILHYVGRDKPWMRYERGRGRVPETLTDLCRRLRDADAETCSRYRETRTTSDGLEARPLPMAAYGHPPLRSPLLSSQLLSVTSLRDFTST